MKRIMLGLVLGFAACAEQPTTYHYTPLDMARQANTVYGVEHDALAQRITASAQAFRAARGCELRHLHEVQEAAGELESLPSRHPQLSSYSRGLNAATLRAVPSVLNGMASVAADRRCYDLARTIYLRVIELYPEPWAAAARQRAQIGIDDLRAQRR